AAGDRLGGVLGPVAALVSVRPGFEQAVAAALGAAADAVGIADLDAAAAAFAHLKAEDLGRVGLVRGDAPAADRAGWPELPGDAVYAVDVVTVAPGLRGGVHRLLRRVAVVADLGAARALLATHPDVTAVTRDGDLLGVSFAAGGSSAKPSLLEIQAAVDEASERHAAAQAEVERVAFEIARLTAELATATGRREAALARLNESDAAFAAVADEFGRLKQVIAGAAAEADRLTAAVARAEETRAANAEKLAAVQERLRLAAEHTEVVEADPAERDRLAVLARAHRQAEMEARLQLRTAEERARALAGRAESLQRAAQAERHARERDAQRRAQLLREAEVARAAATAAEWLTEVIGAAQAAADRERRAADERRQAAEQRLSEARRVSRDLAREFESLVDAVHRDELARAEQRMRVEALAARALDELGLTPDVLVADYGPDVPVPVLTGPDGRALTAEDEPPAPVPFVREQQEKRLRAAERALAQLGRINPLALEEFEALQERHAFLAEQLADLRKTREDLAGIIHEVDARVEQVFAEAFADVERAFAASFARLFPGGEGRLVLTEPGQWLTTGVDVEARPAGKKVKRLSLLSGGERSLVAIAFLVALFQARPSPFYILDEVEAALDDVNLGRLLGIYEELRRSSQMLVITHQKRTMEVADALYGVTMREDGVTTVISSRLRDGARVS
nr:chromosome segregation protein SMC [Propionibacterium sp.]